MVYDELLVYIRYSKNLMQELKRQYVIITCISLLYYERALALLYSIVV